MKKLNCKYCHQEFTPKYKVHSYCSLSCSTGYRNKKSAGKRKENYIKKPNLCQECQNPLEYNKKNNKFCSTSCSAIYENHRRKETNWTHPSKNNQSKEELIEQLRRRRMGAEGPFSHVSFATCKITGKLYRSNIPNSKGHIQRSPYVKLDEKTKYYEDAKFTFHVYDFPDKFNLNLIEKHGWYSTPGSRNGVKNVNGVSRDHMISISEGFKLGIDPKLLAHPANCQLLQHRDNQRKHGRSSITLDELYKRIEEWKTN